MRSSGSYLMLTGMILGVDVVSGFSPAPAWALRQRRAYSRPHEDACQRCPSTPSRSSGGYQQGVRMSNNEEFEQNAATASVLANALPFLQSYAEKTVVIKYGGHAMENAEASLSFARDVVMLKQCGVNPVVVHGGGPQIAAMLKRLDMPTSFVEGVRVSDAETVEVAEMVLCGSINKGIANSIKRAGGRALGISGKDDNLLIAKKMGKKIADEETGEVKEVDIGFVGDITTINTRVIRDLVQAGIVPVIAPIGVDALGQTYNCNADTAAGAIAGALKAHRLLLLTDVPGVLNKEKQLLPLLDSKQTVQAFGQLCRRQPLKVGILHSDTGRGDKEDLVEMVLLKKVVNKSQVKDLIEDETISGGMIPKVNTALDAVNEGVGASIILDGRVRNALLLELFTPGGAGTLIRLPQ